MQQTSSAPPSAPGTLATVLLLGAISFANAVGTVIVFPLGPFLARDLGARLEDAALASMSFTMAAGVGGLAGAMLLARANVRIALCASLLGLAVTTVAAGFAPDFPLLLAARVAGGLCAGPLMGLLVAAVSGAVPETERARAIGAIVGSYGLAIVLGLPLALAFASGWGGWRTAFFATALLCAVLLPPAWVMLGRQTQPAAAGPPTGLLRLLRQPESLLGLLLIAMASFGTLLISPNLSTYALQNAGMSAGALQIVYALGGGVSLFTTQAAGWVIDRIGPLPASLTVGTVMTLILLGAFGPVTMPTAALVVLLGLLLAVQLARSTIAQASAARVSIPADRVAYQCLASATTSFFQGAGAGVSTLVLAEQADGTLLGMGWLAGASIALSWLPAAVLTVLERKLASRAQVL